jgi:hypothetical protein
MLKATAAEVMPPINFLRFIRYDFVESFIKVGLAEIVVY